MLINLVDAANDANPYTKPPRRRLMLKEWMNERMNRAGWFVLQWVHAECNEH